MDDYIIISGFSGIGKSYATKDKSIRDILVDLDSSKYEKTKNWVDEYIKDIKECINNYINPIILISVHSEVRKALKENNLDYIIVAPEFSIEAKNEYMKRYFYRRDSVKYIKNMSENWNIYMNSIINDNAPKIYLNKNEYLNSILKER